MKREMHIQSPANVHIVRVIYSTQLIISGFVLWNESDRTAGIVCACILFAIAAVPYYCALSFHVIIVPRKHYGHSYQRAMHFARICPPRCVALRLSPFSISLDFDSINLLIVIIARFSCCRQPPISSAGDYEARGRQIHSVRPISRA